MSEHQRRAHTIHRLAGLAGTVAITSVLTVLGAAAAHAESSDVNFQKGSEFTQKGGVVTAKEWGGDSIKSENVFTKGGVVLWLMHEIFGLPGTGDFIDITDEDRPDEPVVEPVDGGAPSGGVTMNEDDGTDPTGGEDEEDPEDPEDPDCADCPTGTAMPNPDSDTDGPHGPAVFDPSQLASVPTEDGGPTNPLTSLYQPTADGDGPISPLSEIGTGLSALGH
ncbi:MAG: hypothetical protein QOJ92_624 [Frankiales bacterium]|nr:hypothetical protein [Frankiales bacterium]